MSTLNVTSTITPAPAVLGSALVKGDLISDENKQFLVVNIGNLILIDVTPVPNSVPTFDSASIVPDKQYMPIGGDLNLHV